MTILPIQISFFNRESESGPINLLEGLRKGGNAQRLREALEELPVQELDQVLTELAGEPLAMGRAVALLSPETVSELTNWKIGEFGNVLDDIDKLTAYASTIAAHFEPREPGTASRAATHLLQHTQGVLKGVKNFLTHLLDTFVAAHDYSKARPSPQRQGVAQSSLSSFYTLLTGALALLTFLISSASLSLTLLASAPLWAPYAFASAVALMALLIIGLYLRIEKGAPEALSLPSRNLSLEASQGLYAPIVGREKEMRDLVLALGALDRNSLHPLLVGENGVGKSALVEELARQVAEGRHPQLKGTQIFVINGASLKDSGSFKDDYRSRLEVLLDDVAQSPDQVILFVEHVEALLSKEDGGEGQKLAHLMRHNRLHVIATAAIEGYQEKIQTEPSLNHLFHPIQVSPLRPNDAEAALMDNLRRAFPEVPVTAEAVNTAQQVSNGIAEAQALLFKAVHAVRHYSSKEWEELRSLDDELRRLKQTQENLSLKVLDEIRRIEKRKSELQNVVATHHEGLKALDNLRQTLRSEQKAYVQLAKRIAQPKLNEQERWKRAKPWLVSLLYRQPFFQEKIAEKQDWLWARGVATEVTEQLVHSVR